MWLTDVPTFRLEEKREERGTRPNIRTVKRGGWRVGRRERT